MSNGFENPTYDELREILSHLNYADRDQWYQTFAIVGREYPNDSIAFDICKQWSSQYSGRKPEDESKEREEFYNQSKREGAHIGSLIDEAKKSGYKPKRPHKEEIDPHGTQAYTDLFTTMANRMANSMNVVPEKNDPLLNMYGEAQKAAQSVLKFWMWEDQDPKLISPRLAFLRRYNLAFYLLPKKERKCFEVLNEYCQQHTEYKYDALVTWAKDNRSDFSHDETLKLLSFADSSGTQELADEHMQRAIDLSWQLHTHKCCEALIDYLRQSQSADETQEAIKKFNIATERFNPQLPSLDAGSIAATGRRVVGELLNPQLASQYYQATGYDKIDQYIYGWRRGEVSIMAAHSGVGKTWFGVDAARNTIAAKGNVLFVTTEMSQDSIAERFFYNTSETSLQRFKDNLMTQEQALNEATQRTSNFFVDDSCLSVIYATDLSTIVSAIDARNVAQPINLVVVDYLQNIYNDKADHRNSANWERVNSVMNELTKCANRNHLPILVLAQLNNPNRKAGNNQEPNLYDIADASGVVRDAAAVLMMYRVNAGQTSDISELRCKIVKSRYGNLPESHFNTVRTIGSRFSFVE